MQLPALSVTFVVANSPPNANTRFVVAAFVEIHPCPTAIKLALAVSTPVPVVPTQGMRLYDKTWVVADMGIVKVYARAVAVGNTPTDKFIPSAVFVV